MNSQQMPTIAKVATDKFTKVWLNYELRISQNKQASWLCFINFSCKG